MPRCIAILLFDEIELLDFAGPFEVFSVAMRLAARAGVPPPFELFTIASSLQPVRARGGLQVVPAYALGSHPEIDVLIVPGGVVDAAQQQPELIEWLRIRGGDCEMVASVCTGAFLLAQAGLLDGRTVTTHWEDLATLRAKFPGLQVVGGVPWVQSGHIVTSAGISAGIAMSLALVAQWLGPDAAMRVARQMEYSWSPAG